MATIEGEDQHLPQRYLLLVHPLGVVVQGCCLPLLAGVWPDLDGGAGCELAELCLDHLVLLCNVGKPGEDIFILCWS